MLTKTETFAGLAEYKMIRHMAIDPEVTEVVEGNKRRQEETGGYVVTIDVLVADEIKLRRYTKTVSAVQLATVTLKQIADYVLAQLRVDYGVS